MGVASPTGDAGTNTLSPMPDDYADDRVLTTDLVAALLKLAPHTVIRHVQRGIIPASRLGGEYRYWRPLVREEVVGADPEPDSDTEPDVLTVDQLAGRLKLTPATIVLRIEDQSIKAHKVGKVWRILWAPILRTLSKGDDFT